MKRFESGAAFIFAGGASSRMGRDKGLLEFGGVPLIFWTAHLLMPIVAIVTVVGTPNRYPPPKMKLDNARPPCGCAFDFCYSIANPDISDVR